MEEKKTYLYAEKFNEQLKNLAEKECIGSVYRQIFSFLTNEELDEEIERVYNVYSGKDEYYKENGVSFWFTIWHKSVRQVDYFYNIHGYRIVNNLTEEQKNELKELEDEMKKLKSKVIIRPNKNGENYKEHESSYKTLSLYDMEEYKVLLKKIQKLIAVKNAKEDISLGGKMDSILWNMIQVDAKGHLYEAFIRTFNELDLEEKLKKFNQKEEV